MEYSTTQQRMAAISHQPVLKKSTFVAALAIFGVFSALAGIISLATAIILPSDAVMLTDAVYEFSLAALIFASSKAFTRHSMPLSGTILPAKPATIALLGIPISARTLLRKATVRFVGLKRSKSIPHAVPLPKISIFSGEHNFLRRTFVLML